MIKEFELTHSGQAAEYGTTYEEVMMAATKQLLIHEHRLMRRWHGGVSKVGADH